VRGDVLTRPGFWDAVVLTAGGTFQWDSSASVQPTLTAYNHFVIDWFSAGRWKGNKTGGRFTVKSVTTGGALPGFFDQGNNSMLIYQPWQCDGGDFFDIDSGQTFGGYRYGWLISGNDGGDVGRAELTFTDCTFTRCADVVTSENVSGSTPYNFAGSTWIASVGTANARAGGFGGSQTAIRSIAGAVFDKQIALNGPAGLLMDGAVFGAGYVISAGDATTPAPGVGCFHAPASAGPSVTGVALKDSVLVADDPAVVNPHYMELQQDPYDMTWDGDVIECLSAATDGDVYLADQDSPVNTTVTIQKNIKLPNAVGLSSGTLLNAGRASGSHKLFVVKKSTVHIGENNAGVLIGEFGDSLRGLQVRDNLAWDQTRIGDLVARNSGSQSGIADVCLTTDLHHNGRFNLLVNKLCTFANGLVTTPGYDGLKFSANSSAGLPGANDVVDVDPLFVDKTVCLSKWDWSLRSGEATAVTATSPSANVGRFTLAAHGMQVGDWVTHAGFAVAAYNVTARIIAITTNTYDVTVVGSPSADSGQLTKRGTAAHAIAEIKKRNLSTFDSRYTVPLYVTYIRAGYTPQATAYQSTASDAGDIGAVNVIPLVTGPTAKQKLFYRTMQYAASVAALLLPHLSLLGARHV
jgi:hypothetical protein